MESEKRTSQIAYILQNKDATVLKESTAGGAFTAIAEWTLKKGGIVFGVEMTDDYEVCHTSVEDDVQLFKFRNSKYVQSKIGDTFKRAKELLEIGRYVCFSGTPCQIEGLRSYLQKEYENLILVDVVCRAVPSPGVWNKYIQMEKEDHGLVTSIRFRDKTLGYQYSTMELKTQNGSVLRGGIESQPWLRMFFSGMIIRPSCTECKFRNRYRNSDFTIWDCFNTYSIDKSFDEDAGTTRILIHSSKGKKIFEEIKTCFKYKEIPADVAVDGVQEMLTSPKAHERRQEFFGDLETSDMKTVLNKYYPVTLKIQLKKCARRVLNSVGLDKTLKHILKKG